jgi:hypothetical protein
MDSEIESLLNPWREISNGGQTGEILTHDASLDNSSLDNTPPSLQHELTTMIRNPRIVAEATGLGCSVLIAQAPDGQGHQRIEGELAEFVQEMSSKAWSMEELWEGCLNRTSWNEAKAAVLLAYVVPRWRKPAEADPDNIRPDEFGF